MLQINTNVQQEGTGRLWYLSDAKGLDDVTDKDSNAKLGIISMKVTAAHSEAQKKQGVVANVFLNTIVGGISVSVFRNDDGHSLRLVVPQDSYKENGETKYSDILSIVRPIRAQVLRHVHKLCEASAQAEAQAPAQPVAQAQVAPAGMTPELMAQFQQFLAFQQMQQQGAGVQASAPAVETPAVPGIIGAGDDNQPF